MPPLKLVWRNLFRRPLALAPDGAGRSPIAIFLDVRFAHALDDDVGSGAENSDTRGAWWSCPPRGLVHRAADELPGEDRSRSLAFRRTTKFQWFGGYYQSMKNWFGQFAVDPEALFDIYPECHVHGRAERQALLA